MIDLRTQAIRLIDSIGFIRADATTRGPLNEHIKQLAGERNAYGPSPPKIEAKDRPIVFPRNHVSRGVI